MRVAVLDTETTGFPNLAKQNLFHLVELGAVVVDVGTGQVNFFEPFHSLVLPPDHARVLEAPQTQVALNLSGTDLKGDVLRWGFPLEAVQEGWRQWCARHHINAVTAFNSDFDRQAVPWVEQPWASCLMRWSAAAADASGGRPWRSDKRGRPKNPKVSEAAAWLQDRGCAVPDPTREHRALDDAKTEACIMAQLLRLHPGGFHVR